MILNQQAVDAYKEILNNPSKHGMDFKPINELLVPSETVIAKHVLFDQFVKHINKPLPKVIFYILMDSEHQQYKGDDGNLGYKLSLKTV